MRFDEGRRCGHASSAMIVRGMNVCAPRAPMTRALEDSIRMSHSTQKGMATILWCGVPGGVANPRPVVLDVQISAQYGRLVPRQLVAPYRHSMYVRIVDVDDCTKACSIPLCSPDSGCVWRSGLLFARSKRFRLRHRNW